jgi:hypothetical protein
MKRLISHSEASTLLDCQYRHAFAYTGQLTDGEALKSKTTAPILREGRAWGAAAAAFHSHDPDVALEHAKAAMEIRLSLDAADQQAMGTYDAAEHTELAERLLAILDDYAAHTEQLQITRLEDKLEVAIPSRTGKRPSNRYWFEGYVDGVHTDSDGRDWIVEFKLRKRLSDFEMIAKARQTRWYAWAWRQITGRPVAGVIVDERLNAVPSPLKLNQDDTPSRVQSCRPDVYAASPLAAFDVLAKLEAKDWEKRHPLLLTERELDEAGLQLASVGFLVQQFDSGQLYPVRNPSPMRCPGCPFKEICVDAGDTELVDALYERRPPKRERKEEAHASPVH